MKHFTHSAPSSKSTDFDTNLTPIQAAAAIALGFGLQIPAVAAELKIHRTTLYNWAKNPLFFKAVESANAEFQKQFRLEIALLTRLALTNIQQILADTEASPSVRLKAALAVLKQDWKLPNSTDFDTNSQESDSLRNEMPPESPEPPQPVRSEKIGRNEPCPCGSTLKYKRCCGNPLRGDSTDFDTPLSMK
ncbi:MAG: SEC-C domain-containing protein [Bryobacterales bacterium]|nr:SEC-C domain-containing protein [Bryobacterales bacterium]